MLRSAVTMIAAVLFSISVILLLVLGYAWQGDFGKHSFVLGWLVIQSGALLAGLVFERIFYKPIEDRTPGAGWQATGERFIDPDTHQAVEVWYHQASGERRYVAIPPN